MAIFRDSFRKYCPSSVQSYLGRLTPGTQVFVLLVICFVAMRLWRLTAVSLDGDEMCSLVLVRGSWHDLMGNAIREATHPPLFFVLLKLWLIIGGESLLWLRLLPVIISTLCLIPFFLLCRTVEIRPIARNLALGIAAVHPYAIFYAQHLRMYCLLMLVSLASAWCFAAYLRQPSRRGLVMLTAINVAMVYTHYYGWMIIGLEFLFLLWQRRHWLAMAAGILVTAILFSPWVFMVERFLHAGLAAQKLSWVAKPPLFDLAWFFVDLIGCADYRSFGTIVTTALLAVGAILLFAWRRRQDAGVQWLTILAIAPAVLLFIVSQQMPLWGHRHLIFAFWPFLITLADGLCRLPRKAVGAVLVLAGLWGTSALYYRAQDDRKLPWDTLVVALLDREQSGSAHIPLYSLDRDTHFPLWFYIDCLRNGNVGLFGSHLESRKDIPELSLKSARFEVEKANNLDSALGEYFWIAYSDSNTQAALSAEQTLNRRGCRRGDAISARDRFHTVILTPVQCPAALVARR